MPAAVELRYQVADSPNRKTARPLTTLSGVEPDIVAFSEKPRAWCAECFTPLVRALGVNSIEDYDPYVNDLIDRFDREADMQVAQTSTGQILWVKVYHPNFLEEPYNLMYDSLSRSEMPEITRRYLAEQVVRRHVEALLCDLGQTQNVNAPLGTTLRFYKQILHEEAGSADEALVAFQMELPILQGVDPEILLKIRNDERDKFGAFRYSLRTAIKERLRESDATDPKEIAQEIRRDVIDPALNKIERTLNGARSALLRKGAVSVGVGALATTCGLLTANPLLIGSGLGTAMLTVPDVKKYIDEARDVSLSDMYFLWRAQKHVKELA
jgi:hypothetical protein